MRTINYIVVISTDDPEATIQSETRAYLRNGLRNVPYHWLITAAGEIQEGRVPAESAYCVPGKNKESLVIALAGQRGTLPQEKALEELTAWLLSVDPQPVLLDLRG